MAFKKCQHKWTKISDEVLFSTLQDMLQAGLTKFKGADIYEMGIKTHVVILTCEKCGQIKKLVTRSKG